MQVVHEEARVRAARMRGADGLVQVAQIDVKVVGGVAQVHDHIELTRRDVSPLASSTQLKAALEDIEKSYAAALRTQIESIFNQMDLNKDGNLDPMELFKRLSGLEIEEQYIENVFYSMDACAPRARHPRYAYSSMLAVIYLLLRLSWCLMCALDAYSALT